MKNILLTIGLLFSLLIAYPAYAQANCDNLVVSGMSDAQIIKLKQQCVELNRAPVSAAETASQVAEYAELGQKYGIAISEVAKSIGTTVNELAFTPVGIFLLVIVAWKTVGGDLLGVIGGTVWFIVMLPLWLHLLNKFVLQHAYIMTEKFNDAGKRISRAREPVKWTEGSATLAVLMFIPLVAICITGIVLIF